MTSTVRPPRSDVRSAVIQAASDLFRRHGYAATTLDQVAAAAGFTKGAIYSNFGGKPELLAAAVTDWFAGRSSTAVQNALLLGGEQSGELARQLAEIVLSDPWPRLMNEFRGLAQHDPAVARVYVQVRLGQQTQLAAQLRTSHAGLGLSQDIDYDATALLLLTVISGLATEHVAAPQTTTPAVVEATMAQLLRAVRR